MSLVRGEWYILKVVGRESFIVATNFAQSASFVGGGVTLDSMVA